MYLSNVFTLDRFSTWMDIMQASFMPMLKEAIFTTIPLTIITFIIGLILATLTALARISNSRILQWIARIYVSIIRGTPLLVQLFLIFYGLPTLQIEIDPYTAAVIGFSLNVGAYASEIIRASILSIPKGQWEAAYTMGMTYTQALKRIILPQATRVSIPPLSNTFISLVKDTSLASLILVTEMFRKAQEIAAMNYEFLIVYFEAALMYWVICFLLSIVQQILEKRTERYILK
ncbi:amino acid ABC transporter permease [Bacillus cytotoxicus]|uniref:Polar amino acid ABC transporter, inner membrane subunit n=2 Tax=Bacillus TaxID=1386 RepID=A7GLM6_BACCN|nr:MULTISPECIES: amino acid ABC transporter permease [Bacillus cereus group]ABS21034.1 polar amino acid ABC transporter, inner membrane subunit [Bacillus cytotoxicus NVH 391-98]AWC27682.1 amino acid ABC transporter permease [Bacillus cytotoxicus]AWC31674.1 amino acid ABC transporter permease [Bacillus cytotoxicus]AWC35713.1 amino acid ABC transporter permease [Bacillus cytotoxicus]AWC40942.1 amino acid ABC transporter permease [Bacillus cytotoxicus]